MNVLGQITVVLGALILLTAGAGVLKFPDLYTRASAVSTAAGFGIAFLVLGTLLIDPSIGSAVKVAIIIPIHLATAAVGSMAIVRSGYITGTPLFKQVYNEVEDGPASGPDADDAATEGRR